MNNSITQVEKLKEIADFLNININALQVYRWRRDKKNNSKLLFFRFLANTDLKTLEALKNDNLYDDYYFLKTGLNFKIEPDKREILPNPKGRKWEKVQQVKKEIKQ